jgi:uncharacterized membrane protein YczE
MQQAILVFTGKFTARRIVGQGALLAISLVFLSVLYYFPVRIGTVMFVNGVIVGFIVAKIPRIWGIWRQVEFEERRDRSILE